MEPIFSEKRRGRIIRYAPLFIWIGVIFYLSSSQGSFGHTSRFIRPLLEFLFPAASPETLALYHGYVRKFAHPAVYAVLGLAAAHAFAYSSKTLLNSFWHVSACTLVVIVAIFDEINQSYNPARTGSTWDVLLDSVGGGIAVFVLYFISRRRSTGKKGNWDVTDDR
jgi:VanZ family protein